MRHLTLIPGNADDVGSPEPVAYVPVKVLLAASGRCSCDDCCRSVVRSEPRSVRVARRTDRQPVRNIHLLS